MRRETPVLSLNSYKTDYECKYKTWVCCGLLGKFFESPPPKISLVGDTEPSKDALRVRLKKHDLKHGLGDDVFLFSVGRDAFDVLHFRMGEFARQFVDAGHTTVYVTVYEE